MKLVKHFGNIDCNAHELVAWNLDELSLHFSKVILPKEYIIKDLMHRPISKDTFDYS